MKPLACVLRLNFISPWSPKSKYYISTLSWEPIQNAWHWELLYFCDYRCKILYNSICKQGEFISLYSWIWNPDVQFACAACSIQCLSCMHKIFSSSAIPYRLGSITSRCSGKWAHTHPPKERLDACDFVCWFKPIMLPPADFCLAKIVAEIITSKQKVLPSLLPWSIAWRGDFDGAET